MSETPSTNAAQVDCATCDQAESLYAQITPGTVVEAQVPFINAVGQRRTRVIRLQVDATPWCAANPRTADGSYSDGQHRTVVRASYGNAHVVLTDTIRITGPLPDCCYREGTQDLLEAHRRRAHNGRVVYLDRAGLQVVAPR